MSEKQRHMELETTQPARAIPFEPRSLMPTEALCIYVLSKAITPMNSFAVYRGILQESIHQLNDRQKKQIPTELSKNEKELRKVAAEVKIGLKKHGLLPVPNVRTVAGALEDLSALGWINKRDLTAERGRKRPGHAVAVYFLSEDIEKKAKEFYEERGVF